MASPIGEPTARKISPLFFVLAGLCFLLPFAGVSCNTDTAKSTLSPLIAASGGGNPQQVQQINACLDALNNYNLATYSGANLLTGSAPSVNNGSGPEACKAVSGGTTSTATATDAGKLKLDTQPLLIAAAVCIVAAFLLGILRLPLRGLIVAGLSVAAIVLLLLQFSRESGLVSGKILAAANAGSGAGAIPGGIDISSFVKTTMGIGLILCLVVLGLAALYSLASLAGGGGASRRATAEPGAAPGGYPPPEGYGGAGPPGHGGAPPPPPPGGGYAPPPPPRPPGG